jgi:hypothetical protein
MIRAKTCFVAEGVITDRDTDRISAFALLDDVQAASYPLLIQKLAFFCLWGRTGMDPQRVTCEFSITLNGQDIVRHGLDVDFQQYLHNRCVIRLDGFTLNEPGVVVFRLAVPDHDTAEWTLDVVRTASTSTPRTVGPTGSGRIYDSGNVSISVGGANVHAQ